MNPPTLEREFTLHSTRWKIQDWPRSLLEQQFLAVLEAYLAQQDTLLSTADTLARAEALIETLTTEDGIYG